MFLSLTCTDIGAVALKRNGDGRGEWAGPLERALGPVIQSDLNHIAPGLATVDFECRTTLCRIQRTGEREERSMAMRAAGNLFGDYIAGSVADPSYQIRGCMQRELWHLGPMSSEPMTWSELWRG